MRNYLQCIWWNDIKTVEPDPGRKVLCMCRGRFHTKFDVYMSDNLPEFVVAWCYLNTDEVISEYESTAS